MIGKIRCLESGEPGGDTARTELLPRRRTGAGEEKLGLEEGRRQSLVIFGLLTLVFTHTSQQSSRIGVCSNLHTLFFRWWRWAFCHLSLSILRCSTRTVFFLMAVILLFSFPPAETFDFDALRRTVHDFKKHFSVRLLLDPHIPRFFCLSAGLATAHQDHRFLPLLLRPSCSRLCEGGRCAVTYHQHERGFVYFPRFLGLTCCLSPTIYLQTFTPSERRLACVHCEAFWLYLFHQSDQVLHFESRPTSLPCCDIAHPCT